MMKYAFKKNTVIFAQDALTTREIINLEEVSNHIVFWGTHSKEERKKQLFKFGFVIKHRKD